jgi:GH15 family glucan-1,4-alpha-glucosidase
MTRDAVSSDEPARTDGFAAIESYGVIGDSESVTLVARGGAIDWWAAPAIDSPPVFTAVLDPRDGGCFTLEPAVPYQAKRRYLPGTNVLETTFSTRDGTVRVLDSLNQGANGPLPWAELARDIRPEHGEVPMRWRVAAGTLFHRTRPWARIRDVPILHAGNLVRNGHARQARMLWHELIAHVSDLGLLAEEIDPATGAFLGNLPQGLSHLALLNAAALLDEQQGG